MFYALQCLLSTSVVLLKNANNAATVAASLAATKKSHMSTNPKQTTRPGTRAQLRHSAETKISHGNTPVSQGGTLGPASLALLHRLASDPATAGDASKLLHELQVHQVELDLQHEHMNDERLALEQSMLRVVELFAFAPVAYFLVTVSGQIVEGNLAGARLFGVEREDIDSKNITRLVSPDSRATLLALLAQVQSSSKNHSCRVQALDAALNDMNVTASASADVQHCMVVVTCVDNAAGPNAQLAPA